MNIEPIFYPPSKDELKNRLVRLQSIMEKNGLDYYVAFSPDNILYLTNFATNVHERPFILVVPQKGKLQFVVPQLEMPHVRTRAVADLELISYFEFPAPKGQAWSDRFKELFTSNCKVGVESICPLQIYTEIPGERLLIDIIDDIRMIKSDYEKGRLAYSCNLATHEHNMFLESAHVDMTLTQMNSKVREFIFRQLLLDDPELNPVATKMIAVFQPPSISFDPHNFTNINMQMEEGGPHISIINAVMNGYGAEVERTFFLGQVPEKAKKPFEIMLEGRRIAFEMAKPGNLMSDVDQKVNDYFRKVGMGENLLHRTGHGMGVTSHEAPFFAEGYEYPIQEGMSFTIEPGIYIEGIGGFRHSDTILIGKDGPIMLTDGPITMDELTLPI
ncbi:M24 family metallopeptidase [Acinetobacter seifertii]|uniref:Xaa-Pro peptidase family protein n=1 Tax=Acinetobacter seifertii TaxID=1530123 RepID=A0ABX8L3J3_9GAMM|nr:Xaa-Pro peptidase family protein [Acinetobacter seifertii]QXB46608.1 Xaa-Pro peptidase family protein [Acinetobacter seifertii]